MARREPRRARLDQPRADRRVTLRPDYDPEAFGKLSERFARFMGTAKFIIAMTLIIFAWLVWNVVTPHHLRFDTYANKFSRVGVVGRRQIRDRLVMSTGRSRRV